MNKARLVVLISGNGSNLQSILDACSDGSLQAQVVAVFCTQPDAYGLERAAQVGVPTVTLTNSKEQERRACDTLLADQVAAYRPDWVVLAGWMRILTSAFLDRFSWRVVNLHPALPEAFPGTHAIERAYEAWQRGEIDRTGVMVHLVPDEGVDCGPVLGVEEILFGMGEPLDEFESRVHAAEHRLLIDTLKRIIAHPEVVREMERIANK